MQFLIFNKEFLVSASQQLAHAWMICRQLVASEEVSYKLLKVGVSSLKPHGPMPVTVHNILHLLTRNSQQELNTNS